MAEEDPPVLDPRARLPADLQTLFGEWDSRPPYSQFSQYGPLNAYLGIKFSSYDGFLVKPQKRVREEIQAGGSSLVAFFLRHLYLKFL
jgi:hypothetical protein